MQARGRLDDTMRHSMWLSLLAPGLLIGQPFLELIRKPVLEEAERRSMMYSFVDRNLPSIELPNTSSEWEKRKPQLRKEILRATGLEDLDRRGPVRWSSRGKIERDGYTIEKILYESYPGMMVPALVYVPKNLSGRAPAMVSISGHNYCEGKAVLHVQSRSVNLALRGVIAMAYDYIGTFERNTGADPCASKPYGGGNDHGHRMFSYTAGNPTGLEILDGIRAIDYLMTRSDVDSKRVGFTGESGGSNSTYWVSALDDRVALSVPVASVTTFDYWIRNNRNWDWHQRPAGIRRTVEISTLLALFAPRPLLVISSLRGTDSDEFPLDEAERAVNDAKRVYALYGAADRIRLWESSTSHGYQQDKRERMYAFLERHFLAKETETSPELPFLFEPQTQLACELPSGNKTLASIYREWLDQAPTPAADLREVLGLSSAQPQSSVNVQTTTSRGDVVMRQLIIGTEPGIHLPAVELSPRGAAPFAPTVLALGRTEEMARAAEALLAKGLRVVLIDVRGTGEIESGGGRTDNWAWFLGRPWPGMWVQDIQSAMTALAAEHTGTTFKLVAPVRFGKTAILAAALDSRIRAVHAHLPALSLRREAERGGLSEIPRILSVLDIPQAVGLIAPRPTWIEFEQGVTDGDIQAAYGSAKDSYGRIGASSAFRANLAQGSHWEAVADWLSR